MANKLGDGTAFSAMAQSWRPAFPADPKNSENSLKPFCLLRNDTHPFSLSPQRMNRTGVIRQFVSETARLNSPTAFWLVPHGDETAPEPSGSAG
jgi:hypothetical protein